MATWIQASGRYYNKDAFDNIGVDHEDPTYLRGIQRNGFELRIGPFTTTAAAQTALTAIIGADPVLGPYL